MKIRIAGINNNDTTNGEGICVSVFLQGWPFHCKGCHNPETWESNGGIEYDADEVTNAILNALDKDGIKRNLSILGGETLDTKEKQIFIRNLTLKAKKLKDYEPKIFLWSGFTYKDCLKDLNKAITLKYIDYLIDGTFQIDKRDITLKWRGSTNQNIINIKTGQKESEI